MFGKGGFAKVVDWLGKSYQLVVRTTSPGANTLWTDGTNLKWTTGAGTDTSIATSGTLTFDDIGSGTNTTAAMLVGTGASLGVSGSGTIVATSPSADWTLGAANTLTWTGRSKVTSPADASVTFWDNAAAKAIRFRMVSDGSVDLVSSTAGAWATVQCGTITVSGNVISSGAVYPSSASFGMISSPAAGKIQLGVADAASPVAQTLQTQSTTSNDTAGAAWTLQGSQGKGTGSGGDISIVAGVTAGSGATANTASTKKFIVAAPKALTSAAAAVNIVDINLPTNDSYCGFEVNYTIAFTDGTNCAIHKGTLHGAAYRASDASCSGTITHTDLVDHHLSGSNTTDTWALVAGTGKVTLTLTSTKGNSVGTVTVGEVSYHINAEGRNSTIVPV